MNKICISVEAKDALINKLDELAEETNDDPCDFNAGISYAVAEIWSLINEMDAEKIVQ
jgi:predicted transcriptional regulator